MFKQLSDFFLQLAFDLLFVFGKAKLALGGSRILIAVATVTALLEGV